MKRLRVVHVVGARPNYMKIAPLMRALAEDGDTFEQLLVHTGQHYDPELSDVFIEELKLPPPDVNLGVGSDTHAKQTAEVMRRFDDVLESMKPDWVVVPGDVNSTLAAALVAVKRGVAVAHVEAGLRSRDLSMPEEVNRIVVDQIAQLLLTPSRDADVNLLAEGAAPQRIRFVGNLMIDSLVRLLPLAKTRWPALKARLGVDNFIAVTLHRPTNVDNPAVFEQIQAAVAILAEEVDIVFPMHPRTRASCGSSLMNSRRLRVLEPLGYLDFLALEAHAAVVLTDSGGVQEETTWLDVPCFTLRATTERPITVDVGTNRLVPQSTEAIVSAVRGAIEAPLRRQQLPELWDGHAAERAAAALLEASGEH